MDRLLNAANVLLPVQYTLLVMAYARVFLREHRGIARVLRPLLLLTLIVHGATVLARGIRLGTFPVADQAQLFSMLSLIVLAIYLALEWRLNESHTTGLFVVAFAFVAQLIASLFSSDALFGAAAARELDLLASIHVFSGIVGIAGVAVASIYGSLFLSLYTAIKRDRFGLFYQRMPDLEALGHVNYLAAAMAFAALTFTAGVGLWDIAFESKDFNVVRVYSSLALWLLYGAAIIAHRFFAISGKRLAYSTLLGLLFAMAVLVVGVFESRGS